MKPEIKNEEFRSLMTALESDYSAFDVARWFCLGEDNTAQLRSARSNLNRKLVADGDKWHRNTSVADVLVAELLGFLDANGYDLNRIERDEEGRLITIHKRPIKDAKREVHRLIGKAPAKRRKPKVDKEV